LDESSRCEGEYDDDHDDDDHDDDDDDDNNDDDDVLAVRNALTPKRERSCSRRSSARR
jgi:hypothetical protein